MIGGFIVKWFLGPFGDRLKHVMLREVGYCSDMEVKDFRRAAYSFDGFLGVLPKIVERNVFIGVGFWLVSDSMEPDQSHMLYDRIVFDFDSKDDPSSALRAALDFTNTISNKHHIDVIVFKSGFKGAHVVIPLSKPTNWRGYQLLWDHFYSLVPEESRRMVDPSMKQWNRLDRAPLTYNIKAGVRKFAEVVHPQIKPQTFNWDGLRKLNPESITVHVIPQPKLLRLANRRTCKEVVAPCMKKLMQDAESSTDLPHHARFTLAAYLLNAGFSIDEVITVFRKQSDFKERVTRYQVEYIARRGLKPYGCDKMREFKLCVSSCGVRNPLNHNYSRVQPTKRIPPALRDFLEDTGLHEFTYEDFRSWLESRGSLDASSWHRWERRLRQWAEEGFLGRKFLVDGEWVDYGSGRLSAAPSKNVVFYFTV